MRVAFYVFLGVRCVVGLCMRVFYVEVPRVGAGFQSERSVVVVQGDTQEAVLCSVHGAIRIAKHSPSVNKIFVAGDKTFYEPIIADTLVQRHLSQLNVSINIVGIHPDACSWGDAVDGCNTLWVRGGVCVPDDALDRLYDTNKNVIVCTRPASHRTTFESVVHHRLSVTARLSRTYDEALRYVVNARRNERVHVTRESLPLVHPRSRQETAEYTVQALGFKAPRAGVAPRVTALLQSLLVGIDSLWIVFMLYVAWSQGALAPAVFTATHFLTTTLMLPRDVDTVSRFHPLLFVYTLLGEVHVSGVYALCCAKAVSRRKPKPA